MRLEENSKSSRGSETHLLWLAIMGFKNTKNYLDSSCNKNTIYNPVLGRIALTILVDMAKKNGCHL